MSSMYDIVTNRITGLTTKISDYRLKKKRSSVTYISYNDPTLYYEIDQWRIAYRRVVKLNFHKTNSSSSLVAQSTHS